MVLGLCESPSSAESSELGVLFKMQMIQRQPGAKCCSLTSLPRSIPCFVFVRSFGHLMDHVSLETKEWRQGWKWANTAFAWLKICLWGSSGSYCVYSTFLKDSASDSQTVIPNTFLTSNQVLHNASQRRHYFSHCRVNTWSKSIRGWKGSFPKGHGPLCREWMVAGCVVSTVRKQRLEGKWSQAKKPQVLSLVTHFLQLGPTSRFTPSWGPSAQTHKSVDLVHISIRTMNFLPHEVKLPGNLNTSRFFFIFTSMQLANSESAFLNGWVCYKHHLFFFF